MNIRVMLADDHCMFLEVLEELLAKESDIEVVARAGSGAETLATVGRALPDVLVLDIAFPDISGIEVARKIAKCHPGIRIVALSGYADKIFVQEMLKAGAQGYVVKSSGATVLIDAIRAVAAGHSFLSPEVTSVLLRRTREGKPSIVPPASILSRREQEILRLIAEGRRSTEIGDKLHISTATVDVHRRNIKRKLGLHSTAELTRYALSEGLASSS